MKKNDKMEISRVGAVELYRIVARESRIPVYNVQKVLEAYEKAISDSLKKACPDYGISIRLIEGLSLESVFEEAHKQKNNLSGQMIDVPDRIKVKAKITQRFKEKLNGMYDE